MSKIRRIMAAFCAVFVMAMMALAPVNAEAQIPGRPQEYVQDEAGVLSDREMASINKALADHDGKTHNRIDVLLVKTTDGEPIEAYSKRVLAIWNPDSIVVTQEARSDAVLVAVTDDGKLAMGLSPEAEKSFSKSALSKAIGSSSVRSSVSSGDWDAAIRTAVRQIGSMDAGQQKLAQDGKAESGLHMYGIFMGSPMRFDELERLTSSEKLGNLVFIIFFLGVQIALSGLAFRRMMVDRLDGEGTISYAYVPLMAITGILAIMSVTTLFAMA